ncbi:dihydroneopterin aldolase [Cytobacillus solani]|uniref:7,8-dihydroneopterin aldolase n=1 Tax=Cytobacillus solani TaxID=1637975 RepID=A0A0Q3RB23_9BACI|nr:dihydroneopterin aldolase [Cytobacillus solani]KOP70400.1 dihydroneopterin aldolase [Bacillus sp. FJAT-21945]KQL27422.1 dihydroneopterin aldolase [Cytobacillus solani]USK55137.1 dihydroneopterin aldolase [Cytobacillus solani]
MDKIILNKMAFYGYHGVFPEETHLGQRFMVDLTVETNLKKAGETDQLEYSINYGEIYQVCKEIVEGKPYKLVEAVAEKIAGEMLDRFEPISQVTVRVIKPDPPIPGHYESVAVEVTRSRM